MSDDKVDRRRLPGHGHASLPARRSTCTATYTVTQADLDAGTVTNHRHGDRHAGQRPPSRRPTPRPSTPTQSPALTLVKTTPRRDRTTAVGDAIGYSYMVTNTGNVTLSGRHRQRRQRPTRATSARRPRLAPGDVA